MQSHILHNLAAFRFTRTHRSIVCLALAFGAIASLPLGLISAAHDPKTAVLPAPSADPPSNSEPTSPASPPRPTLRDLADKLKALDDDELEDLDDLRRERP